MVGSHRAKTRQPSFLCIAPAAAEGKTERKTSQFLPHYIWAHIQPPRRRARLSKQEACTSCAALASTYQTILGLLQGEWAKTCRANTTRPKGLFDVLGRAGFLVQRQLGIVDGSYCTAIKILSGKREPVQPATSPAGA